jgi:hypothetical protein
MIESVYLAHYTTFSKSARKKGISSTGVLKESCYHLCLKLGLASCGHRLLSSGWTEEAWNVVRPKGWNIVWIADTYTIR